MAGWDGVRRSLDGVSRRWLVTGAAGFIGSHLVERLLQWDQEVVGLDNFATGTPDKLEDVRRRVGQARWARFTLIEGDIVRETDCAKACAGADYVLHQAALGSVPRSLADPRASHRANVDGFLEMLVAARDAGVPRFVYASSGAVYGNHPGLPKVEGAEGRPLSPYAATKQIDEIYADVFSRAYGIQCVGLRYFNVFGPRQNPNGPYAAVIPTWVSSLLASRPCVVNGDGQTGRDFCYVENVIQANLLAALTADERAINMVYNIAVGQQTTLLELYGMIRDRLVSYKIELRGLQPQFGPFRPGDIRHSRADTSKARQLLGFNPTHTVAQGLDDAIPWFVRHWTE
jgi:UDP-N-acetylglucosamine 4-epimerase